MRSRDPHKHRPRRVAEEGRDASTSIVRHKWWREADGDETERANVLRSEAIEQRHRSRARRDMCRYYCEQFGTTELIGIGLTSYDPMYRGFIAPSLPYNVSRRVAKTIHAKVQRHKPLPMCMSLHGDYAQQKRAMRLSNFIEGGFTASQTFRRGSFAALFAIVTGTGFVQTHHLPGDDLPRQTVLLPWEVFADAAQARGGDPLELKTMRWRDRTELKDEFPEHEDAIDHAQSSDAAADDRVDYADYADLVLVTEAWRLPVGLGKGQSAGRHMIVVDGAVLKDEKWERRTFPVRRLTYARSILGYFGEGAIAEVTGFQREINYTAETLRDAHRVAGTGIWLVPDNCDIPDTHFENGTGLILRHRVGSPPVYQSPEPANPQSYQYLQQMVKDAPSVGCGLSTLSTSGQKQPGITAGKALEMIQDVEDDGLVEFEDAYEQFYVDLANDYIEECRAMAGEEGGQLRVMAPQRRSVMWIDWKDVDISRDKLVIETWPTSLLGRTPAARMQQITDLMNLGVIDRGQYLKLLGAPDIDSETDLQTALREVCDDQIEHILEMNEKASLDALAAEYEKARPTTYQDLVYALHRSQQHICFGQLRKVPEVILKYLRDYQTDAKNELDKRLANQAPANDIQQRPLAPAPMTPAGMGPAAPAPAPMPPPMAGPPGAPPPMAPNQPMQAA